MKYCSYCSVGMIKENYQTRNMADQETLYGLEVGWEGYTPPMIVTLHHQGQVDVSLEKTSKTKSTLHLDHLLPE